MRALCLPEALTTRRKRRWIEWKSDFVFNDAQCAITVGILPVLRRGDIPFEKIIHMHIFWTQLKEIKQHL